MEAAIKELQETAIVMAGIQSRHVELLKDHAEWLHSHDLAMVRHDQEMAEARERGRATDERIEKMQIEARERGRATDERIEKMQIEARERGRATDERIENLVSAIGKMIAERN